MPVQRLARSFGKDKQTDRHTYFYFISRISYLYLLNDVVLYQKWVPIWIIGRHASAAAAKQYVLIRMSLPLSAWKLSTSPCTRCNWSTSPSSSTSSPSLSSLKIRIIRRNMSSSCNYVKKNTILLWKGNQIR